MDDIVSAAFNEIFKKLDDMDKQWADVLAETEKLKERMGEILKFMEGKL